MPTPATLTTAPPGPLPADLAPLLRDFHVAAVRSDMPDLTARQLAVALIVALDPGPHTVRGLAARLEISKPAVCRAIDRLVSLNLAARAPDPDDGRSVLVTRTEYGTSHLSALRHMLADAARGLPQ